MLELPEVITLSKQLNETMLGKTVVKVLAPTKQHKFCWYNGDPQFYDEALCGTKIIGAQGFGIFAEIIFQNGMKLAMNDGINCRLVAITNLPKAYQLAIEFDDNNALVFTVSMYGGILLHDDLYDNPYYTSSKEASSLLSQGFGTYFNHKVETSKPSLSMKAFLATEQRFSGLGNGVLQDILYIAEINPRRKVSSLSENEKENLLDSISCVLNKMIDQGGRDTEKDLFGNNGRYKTLMSKNTVGSSCYKCGNIIVKETFLGGSIYYCPGCQRLSNI